MSLVIHSAPQYVLCWLFARVLKYMFVCFDVLLNVMPPCTRIHHVHVAAQVQSHFQSVIIPNTGYSSWQSISLAASLVSTDVKRSYVRINCSVFSWKSSLLSLDIFFTRGSRNRRKMSSWSFSDADHWRSLPWLNPFNLIKIHSNFWHWIFC